MSRINLQVSYEEKDLVKSLGALWDLEQRVWFIPDSTDYMPFLKWIRDPNPIERLEHAIVCLTEMLATIAEQNSRAMNSLTMRLEELEKALEKNR